MKPTLLASFVCGAILGLVAAGAAAAQDLRFRSAPDAQRLAGFLHQKNPQLEPHTHTFVDEGRKWDVDPRLVVAIAGAESTFGKRVCASYNAWNWFYRRTCPPSTFADYDEGVRTVTKFMQRSYLRKGFDTIPRIRVKYCTEGCENWVPLVTRFMTELPAGSGPDVSAGPPPAALDPRSRVALPPRVFGVPLAFVLLGGAALIALWMSRLFFKGH